MIHTNVNDANRQCRKYKNGFPMNVFGIAKVATMQRRRCCANIPMNISITMNPLVT